MKAFREKFGKMLTKKIAGKIPPIFVDLETSRPWSRTKRLGDLVIAGALVAFTFWLMAFVALAIKLESPGPVLCRQERSRRPRTGRVVALKFRSTVLQREPYDRPLRISEDAEHLTRVGWFLRYTRIEDLPQLINVVRGEMSLIDAARERPHFLE